jgi:hypothetical protein
MRIHSAGLVLSFLAFRLAAQAQTPVISSVLNSETVLTGPVAPGENVTITGTSLGDATSLTCGTGGATPVPVPTVCGGVAVLVNGTATNIRSEQAQQITFIAPITLTGTSATIQVTMQNGAQQSGNILLVGESATDNTFTNGAAFQCRIDPSAGTFTVPSYALLAPPAGSFAGLDFMPTVTPVNFSATGLNLGYLTARRDNTAFVAFK